MTKTGKNTTEHDKHVAGGPGKSAHNAEKPGNKPGQNQSEEGGRERGAGSGGGRGASEETRDRTG